MANQAQFYIYILYSKKYDKYYIGYTDDVYRRLSEHNEISENSFTCKYRPWRLAGYYNVGPDRGDAMRAEKFIKKQKSRRFIERVLEKADIRFILERISKVG